MDQYQLSLINRGSFGFDSANGSEKIEFNNGFTLYQNENYKISGYKLLIDNPVVDYVLYLGKKYAPKSGSIIEVSIDFNNIGSELTMVFKNGVADDCVLPIKCVLADHSKFDEKEAKENQERLNKNVALVVTKGNSLINVYFKKADDSVTKSVLKIYFWNNNESYLIEESENNTGFKSMAGLGYGTYECTVEQYDSKCRLVASVKSSVTLRDDINELKKSLTDSLDSVKGQVRASGRNTVYI